MIQEKEDSPPPCAPANEPQDIRDIGSAHYDLIHPIIIRIDSAAQLRALEEASPHLEGHTEKNGCA
ncbi:uncharacterized protein PG998_002382 [Apiospora kogelbergensis]|uniref:uncharacterized protein n=1 Tax=Apiospora kogelbergensis TaxID=1337665 RepID=UPI00312E5899